jgi:membrane-associated protease RseP (regulator of RpoE activity)
MYKRYECANCDFYEIAKYDLHKEKCPACGHNYHVFEEDIDEDRYSWLFNTIKNHFYFENFVIRSNSFLFIGNITSDFSKIRETFENMGYYSFIRKKEGKIYLHLFKAKKSGKSRVIFPIILLVATVLSVFYAGISWATPLKEMGYLEGTWLTGMIFAVGLIFILGSHELAHKITAMKNKVDATWPYFIPMPLFPIIGTMGAVISIKSPIPTKKAAIKIGLSGPLIGFIASIVVISIGIAISPVVPAAEYIERASAYSAAHPGTYGIGFGTTLIFEMLVRLFLNVPEGYTWIVHPLVVAGIVGVFVTALNLLPMGQLDGGHVARSILGEKYHMLVSKTTALSLIGIGFLGGFLRYPIWPGWILWGFIGYLISSRGHPGAMDEVTELTGEDKILAVMGIIIFVLCFTPTPIYVVP